MCPDSRSEAHLRIVLDSRSSCVEGSVAEVGPHPTAETLFVSMNCVCLSVVREFIVGRRHAVQWLQCCRRVPTMAGGKPHCQLDSAVEGKQFVSVAIQS